MNNHWAAIRAIRPKEAVGNFKRLRDADSKGNGENTPKKYRL